MVREKKIIVLLYLNIVLNSLFSECMENVRM